MPEPDSVGLGPGGRATGAKSSVLGGMVVGAGSSGDFERAFEPGRGGTVGADDLAGRGGIKGVEVLMVVD